MKKVKNKVKKKFKWYEFLMALSDGKLEDEFWNYRVLHYHFSLSRCAYYVLKSYYSTTSLACIRNIYRVNPLINYDDLVAIVRFERLCGNLS